jgi:hypothetical protein
VIAAPPKPNLYNNEYGDEEEESGFSKNKKNVKPPAMPMPGMQLPPQVAAP